MRSPVGLPELLCVLSFMLSAIPLSAAAKDPLIPYLATGYRYAVVPFDALPGFEQVTFNDSSFSTGDAAFGQGGYCPLDATVRTNWPLNTDLLLRKAFTMPAGASGIEVAIAIDNDVQVFVNGTDTSGGLQHHDGCAEHDSFVFPVPDTILTVGGSNLLAVRARDLGVISYVDVEVRGVSPCRGVWPGDISCDGAICFDDLVALGNYIDGLADARVSCAMQCAGDVDQDGNIDEDDYNLLYDIVASSGASR